MILHWHTPFQKEIDCDVENGTKRKEGLRLKQPFFCSLTISRDRMSFQERYRYHLDANVVPDGELFVSGFKKDAVQR